MPTQLEWLTDEEGWEEPVPPPAGEQKRPPRGWVWRVLLSLLMLLLAGGLMTARYLEQQVSAAERDAEEAVLAVHMLVREAVARNDEELFISLLDGSDRTWRRAQAQAFRQQVLFNRVPLFLSLQPGRERTAQVSVAPNLQQATITDTLRYALSRPGGVTGTVSLRHTLTYRQVNGRWLWTRPGDGFWGNWLTDEGERLTLVYPARDEAVGARLGTDLRAQVDGICAALGGCPGALRVQIRFRRDYAALATPGQAINGRSGQFALGLAAPTLVGEAVDEAGYRALLRGYTRQLAEGLLNHLLGSDWPGSGPFATAFRQQLLVELGVLAWPPVPAGNPEPPPPWPAQDVQLLCVDGMDEGASLYRYDPAGETWQVESAGRPWVRMEPLPGGAGVVLQEQSWRTVEAQPRMILHRPGREAVVFPDLFLAGVADSGGHPVLYAQDEEDVLHSFRIADLDGCDPAGCRATPITGSLPLWAPDGTHTLLNQRQTGELYLGDSEGGSLRAIKDGYAPFWLDNETFGYVRIHEVSRESTEVVLATVAGEDERVLVTSEQLHAALPAGDVAEEGHFFISQVDFHPANAETLFVTTSFFRRYVESQPVFTSYLFAVDRVTGTPILRSPLDYVATTASLSFSPPGRWLAFNRFNPRQMLGAVHLQPVSADEQEMEAVFPMPVQEGAFLPVTHWSADGTWLLVLEEGVLQLVAPDHGYARTIVPEMPGCAFAAWVNE